MTEPMIQQNPDGSTTVVSINDRDTVAESIARISSTTESLIGDFSNAANISIEVPADVRSLLSSAVRDITATLGKVDVAVAMAAGYRANDTMFPAGRERLATAEIAKADSEVTAALDSAEDKLTVAEADLYLAARPAMPAGGDMAARADVRMILDGVSPSQLADRIKGLAQRGDAAGALVADGAWLDMYLSSRGVESDMADAIKALVKDQVFRSAAASGEPKRAAAGRTALALVHLRKAGIAARSYRRTKLS
ncbi:hypothetical protein [Streptomyces sp. NPDC092370]|uniref:hypothetical protein n=1 Tax=Streptomyces sp. NPDC092370 TaxID=3366016 RepID=UPI00380A6316